MNLPTLEECTKPIACKCTKCGGPATIYAGGCACERCSGPLVSAMLKGMHEARFEMIRAGIDPKTGRSARSPTEGGPR